MYAVLVRLMVLAALADLGMSLAKIETCHSRACMREVEHAARKVLKVGFYSLDGGTLSKT